MYKLLLLEDDFSLVDGLMYSLKKNGFDLEVAGTIREAEKLVAGHTGFDLFLFDVTLPDGSGFVREAAESRKSDSDYFPDSIR